MCNSHKSTIAMPKHTEDQSFVNSLLRKVRKPSWIGLHRQSSDWTWHWHDGEMLTGPTYWNGRWGPSTWVGTERLESICVVSAHPSDSRPRTDRTWFGSYCHRFNATKRYGMGLLDARNDVRKRLCQASPGMRMHHFKEIAFVMLRTILM